MLVRYRKLTSSLDPEEIAREREALRYARASWPFSRSDALVDGAENLAIVLEAPRKVTAEEHHASLNRVRALVSKGELSLRDLVDVGHGWQTVEECPELFDQVVAEEDRQKRRRRNLVYGSLCAGLVVIVALFLAW